MIYVSSTCFDGKKIEDVLKKAAECGSYNIELSGGLEYSDNVEDVLKEYKLKCGFNYLVHNYFPAPREDFILNIASSDKSVREKSVEFAKKSIKLASDIGADRYTIHSGYLVDLSLGGDGETFYAKDEELIDRKEALKVLSGSIEVLCDHSDQHNIKFGIENLFPNKQGQNFSLMCTPEDIFQALEEFSRYPNFGILLDLGHAYLSSKILSFDLDDFLATLMRRYKSKVLKIHITDNDGISDRHMVPARGSWVESFIVGNGFNEIPISIEARNDDLKEVLEYYKYLKDILAVKNEQK